MDSEPGVVSLSLSSRALQVGCITHCMAAASLGAGAEGTGASTEQTAGKEEHVAWNSTAEQMNQHIQLPGPE